MFLSIFDIFKIGIGPSSSHTMGPMVAAARFLGDLAGGAEKIPGAGTLAAVSATLHGSLAFTGKGHATDRAVILGLCGLVPETLDPEAAARAEAAVHSTKRVSPEGLGDLRFDPETDLVFDYGPPLPGHANGLVLRAFDEAGNLYHTETYYSVGGGFVVTADELARPDTASLHDQKESLRFPYPFGSAKEMLQMGAASGLSIARMKRANEQVIHGAALDKRIDAIWQAMDDCISRGLTTEGILPVV